MDEDGFPVSLFPEFGPPPKPRWEVTFTLRVERWEGPLVPCAPGVPGVIAMYCAGKAEAIAVVRASDGAEAEALARELCSGMAWVAEAEAEARPAVEAIGG